MAQLTWALRLLLRVCCLRVVRGAGILMDASMDVMNGEECTRVIRMQQLPQRTRPFIIAQTAHVSDDFRKRCLDAGMDAFSTKPVQLDELVQLLQDAHAWHQRNRQQQQQQQ